MLGLDVRETINGLLGRFGYRIVRKSSAIGPDRLIEQLVRYRIEPKTVFDIGVDTGTPWMYEAFPKAKFYLVDPTPNSLPSMQKIARQVSAEILNVAFGDEKAVLKLNLWPEYPSASSFFQEVGQAPTTVIDVPVVRFDETIGAFERPALLKLDVQGAELMVLRGVGDRMKELDAVIVETNLMSTVRDAPEIAAVTAFMNEHGFVLYEIAGAIRRPLDGALALIDAVFVPADSPLRADRKWNVE